MDFFDSYVQEFSFVQEEDPEFRNHKDSADLDRMILNHRERVSKVAPWRSHDETRNDEIVKDSELTSYKDSINEKDRMVADMHKKAIDNHHNEEKKLNMNINPNYFKDKETIRNKYLAEKERIDNFDKERTNDIKANKNNAMYIHGSDKLKDEAVHNMMNNESFVEDTFDNDVMQESFTMESAFDSAFDSSFNSAFDNLF